ncbi:MAG: DNA primase [bacterium]|nr:MAG: DNA primase [bacterium]
MLYSQDVIERVKNAVDIVEVISSYLPLKKSGANYAALCPFHTEKTPSFSVSRTKQIFHCFGCGEGGNAISFVMKYENLPFTETLNMLADRAGISLPKKEADSEFSKLYEINREAAGFYRKQLLSASAAGALAAFIKKRGIKKETLETFYMGYAPDGWDSCFRYLQKKFKPEDIEKAGIIKKSSKGNYIDRFRNRIIFPIFNEKGGVIAFGGRLLDYDTGGTEPKQSETGSGNRHASQPKYLNSPDSKVYNKSKTVYGLNLSAAHVRKADQVLVVEGYTDAISLYQAGIKNVAASAGTAFTSYHCRTLKRFSGNFVMIFDGDDAGRKAAARATRIAMEQAIRPNVAILPKGLDPDELVRSGGARAVEEVVRNAKPYVSYVIELACGRYDIDTAEGRADAARSLLPELACIKDPIERAGYIEEVSQRLKIPASDIRNRIGGSKRDSAQYGQYGRQTGPQSRKESQKEKILVRIMLDHPEIAASKLTELNSEDFDDPVYRKIFTIVTDGLRAGQSVSDVMENVENDEIRRAMSELMMKDSVYEEEYMDKNVEDFLAHVRFRARKGLIEKMKNEAKGNRREDFLHLEENYRKLN